MRGSELAGAGSWGARNFLGARRGDCTNLRKFFQKIGNRRGWICDERGSVGPRPETMLRLRGRIKTQWAFTGLVTKRIGGGMAQSTTGRHSSLDVSFGLKAPDSIFYAKRC